MPHLTSTQLSAEDPVLALPVPESSRSPQIRAARRCHSISIGMATKRYPIFVHSPNRIPRRCVRSPLPLHTTEPCKAFLESLASPLQTTPHPLCSVAAALLQTPVHSSLSHACLHQPVSFPAWILIYQSTPALCHGTSPSIRSSALPGRIFKGCSASQIQRGLEVHVDEQAALQPASSGASMFGIKKAAGPEAPKQVVSKKHQYIENHATRPHGKNIGSI